MSTSIDALRLRRVMGRQLWHAPEPFGPDGWQMVRALQAEPRSSVIVTCSDQDDGREWIHASLAHPARVPSYDELVRLHRAAFSGWAYQVFAPGAEHVNIHEYALHLWGLADGSPALPNFGRFGTI